ncbi:MAG: alpha-glucosidase [Ignavibacteriae bacterium HGW-Ignavibacteriae-2]|nr:MAG: alpha-glucosidase [Ignavibacteriae bacterium HGW-Ignavibacteriae-2]
MKFNFTNVFVLILFFVSVCTAADNHKVVSPDGRIIYTFSLHDGVAHYELTYGDESIVTPSPLGFRFKNQPELSNFTCVDYSTNKFSEVWKPVWGQNKKISNEYNELILNLEEKYTPFRKIQFIVRAYNDGVAFRYHFDKQIENNYFEITDELTFFNFADNFNAWWIPNDYDSEEYTYRNTAIDKILGAHTPITLQTERGTCITIHEAQLKNYSSMTLERNRYPANSFQSVLVPWPDGIRVKQTAPFDTPWRVIIITPSAEDLISSNIILNLNPPPADKNFDWIKPGKYVGVWWAMHLDKESWVMGPKHGATTENVKRYIDFASENNFNAVLAEGWNKGWEMWGKGNGAFSYTECYPDFDITEISKYAKSKNISLIGHHETGGDYINYEKQLDAAFKFYKDNGVNIVKTGYAGPIRPYGYHYGQMMIDHYNLVMEKAYEYNLMLDVHEPIKATGMCRTYPNLMTAEGMRGTEWNAWSIGNPPEHVTILPFTRGLSGPMDYTPGIFDLKYDQYKIDEFVKSTLANQLALYVVLYSPLQMAADLIENYKDNPAFEFIKCVPTDWDTTIALKAVIGDYVVIAREKDNAWYVGAVSDENEREVKVKFDFLEPGNYLMKSYSDGKDAHYINNPYSINIAEEKISNNQEYTIHLAPGGGFACKIEKIN